ncbi:MAG: DoxX family protein [Bdellovibrionota bacterium]|nr:DoxX family protein [Bdellovibrionota bacterium]
MIQKVENLFKANSNLLLLIGRLFIGLTMAISHGYGKMMNMSGFIGNVAKMGFPLPEVMGSLAMGSELIGGLLIAIGFKTRLAAFTVFGTMLVAAFVVHGADPFGKKEFALVYAAACLIIMAVGPGKFSFDKD